MNGVVAVLILLAIQAPQPGTVAPAVLVVDEAKGKLSYKCNGVELDPRAILSGVRKHLEPEPADQPFFVLLADSVPIGEAFTLGSIVGKIGLRNVRYFVFSRQSGVMTEVQLDSKRWKLSEQGVLEPSPR
jgi:hypothetical protein